MLSSSPSAPDDVVGVASDVPQTMLSPLATVPHTMLSRRRGTAVPQTMLSPPSPHAVPHTMLRAHALALGLDDAARSARWLPQMIWPAPRVSAPVSCGSGAPSRRTSPGARRRACSGSPRPAAAGCSRHTTCAVLPGSPLIRFGVRFGFASQHQRHRAADDRRRHARAAQRQIRLRARARSVPANQRHAAWSCRTCCPARRARRCPCPARRRSGFAAKSMNVGP